jgi:hypothetical protein
VRLFGVVVLLAAVGGLGVHYDATAGDRYPDPTSEELATEYENYVGEETRLFGDVERVDAYADRATIRVTSDEGDFELVVERFVERVRPGGVVQVYGTLKADYTMSATNVAVVNPASASKAYKYAVSVVGAYSSSCCSSDTGESIRSCSHSNCARVVTPRSTETPTRFPTKR